MEQLSIFDIKPIVSETSMILKIYNDMLKTSIKEKEGWNKGFIYYKHLTCKICGETTNLKTSLFLEKHDKQLSWKKTGVEYISMNITNQNRNGLQGIFEAHKIGFYLAQTSVPSPDSVYCKKQCIKHTRIKSRSIVYNQKNNKKKQTGKNYEIHVKNVLNSKIKQLKQSGELLWNT